MIRSEYSASCDGCGARLGLRPASGGVLESFANRAALVTVLGSSGWGVLFGETSDPSLWSVVCPVCRAGGVS